MRLVIHKTIIYFFRKISIEFCIFSPIFIHLTQIMFPRSGITSFQKVIVILFCVKIFQIQGSSLISQLLKDRRYLHDPFFQIRVPDIDNILFPKDTGSEPEQTILSGARSHFSVSSSYPEGSQMLFVRLAGPEVLCKAVLSFQPFNARDSIPQLLCLLQSTIPSLVKINTFITWTRYNRPHASL